MRLGLVTSFAALLAASASAGCSSLLGDFSVGGGHPDASAGTDASAPDGSQGPPDASAGRDGSAPDAPAGGDGSVRDGSVPGDAQQGADSSGDGPYVAPTPAKPGTDITAGGNVSQSTNYKLVGAVGESPGGNTVSKSTSYRLQGGVIGTTQ